MSSTKKILIAEDERAIAKALELKLKNTGFEVTVALNGQEALDANASAKFDLIVLDLMMPNVDGYQVLEQLQKIGNKVPIVVASNLSLEDDFKKAKMLGARDYFIKSNTSLAELVGKIQIILNETN